MQPKPLDLAKLLSIPHIQPYTGFDIAPNGETAAFSWNTSGRWQIYQVPLDGCSSPKPLTSGPGAKLAPRYSPDGARLAYVLDLDGGETYDLVACALGSGETSNLTPNTPEAMQFNFSWSPDSDQIAFICDRAGRFDTYIIPSSGGPARLLFPSPHPDWNVRWSPDGHSLAVVSESLGQDFRTTVVPLDGCQPHAIKYNEQRLNAREARWSPGSRRLAVSSDLAGHYDIALYEIANGQITWLTSGPGEKTSPDWSPDEGRLAYIHSDGPDTWLVVLEVASGQRQSYQVDHGVHYAPRFTPCGDRLVFIFENSAMPPDLWALSLESGEFTQLTHSLPEDFTQAAFVHPAHIHYPGLDGESVPGMLYQPPGADANPPAVILVHGGPNWLIQYLWYPLVQHMLSRGWVVLAPNYRGSSGYGRDWQLASRFDLGGVDADDVTAAADFLTATGMADERRIAITGTSHGGYLTMTCLTRSPGRWAAGAAVFPFLNWFTSHQNSRPDLQHWDIENMGDPVENQRLWRERSPFFRLDCIQSPVQIICGANDPRCPASESSAARDALLALGKPVDYIQYADEGHGFLKRENLIDAEIRRVAFMAQALEY